MKNREKDKSLETSDEDGLTKQDYLNFLQADSYEEKIKVLQTHSEKNSKRIEKQSKKHR